MIYLNFFMFVVLAFKMGKTLMLTHWNLSNFKSVQEEQKLELAPLTIFAGANSCGKSTIIQSMLMIAQTLADKVGSRAIVFNGIYAKLGNFSELKSKNSKNSNSEISVGWVYKPLTLPFVEGENLVDQHEIPEFQEIKCDLSFDVPVEESDSELSQIYPRLGTSQLICTNYNTVNNFICYTGKKPKKGNKKGVNDKQASIIKLDKDSNDEIKWEYSTAEPTNCSFFHFLPTMIDVRTNRVNEKIDFLKHVFLIYIANSRIIDFLRIVSKEKLQILKFKMEEVTEINQIFIDSLGSSNLSDLTEELKNLKHYNSENLVAAWLGKFNLLSETEKLEVRSIFKKKIKQFEKIVTKYSDGTSADSAKATLKLPRNLVRASEYIDDFFTNKVKYIGPLRIPPKSLYDTRQTFDIFDVGINGEFTASVYDLHKDTDVICISPQKLGKMNEAPEPVTCKLKDAVADWLEYMNVANFVVSEDRGKLGLELSVVMQHTEYNTDLSHVGFGVSQILPILVGCLLSRQDSTIIIEHPELHLHPDVQVRLCDFLISIMLCKKTMYH